MALALEQVRRYARQIALPEVGAPGQERLLTARAAIVGAEDDDAVATAALYLRAAGVATDVIAPVPGEAWLAALAPATIALRFDFDDDSLLRATVRLGIPLVVARARRDEVELLAFRQQGPCPHAALDLPRGQADRDLTPGAAAVVAGTIAATEALFILLSPGPPRARLLRLPLDGRPPLAHDLPWAPECFLCGGHGREASFTRS